MTDGLTLTIVNDGRPGGMWTVPQSPEEANVMRRYIERVDGTPGRCASCAFRLGTDASRSRLVLHCVEHCLLVGSTFMCHTGHEDGSESARVCVGFAALRGDGRAVEARGEALPKSESQMLPNAIAPTEGRGEGGLTNA